MSTFNIFPSILGKWQIWRGWNAHVTVHCKIQELKQTFLLV